MPASAVKQMLQCTPRLKSFVYEYFRTSSTLELDHLHTGIEYVRSTLEDLTVRIGIAEAITVEPSGRAREVLCGKLGSLRSFSALKKRSTSFFAPFGQIVDIQAAVYDLSSMLPPHLEHLLIADDLWNLRILIDKTRLCPFKVATPELQKSSADLRQAVASVSVRGVARLGASQMKPAPFCSSSDRGYYDFSVARRRRGIENRLKCVKQTEGGQTDD
ncbi:uncharacterized protein EKO05_0001064 [Ascochyta rabiei]|uniref:uncharacterized protein n=1 Tax=Didymella rabiei TaxID=5454 RepID=UPI00220DCD16|nr:uncharacterized protein EKO05_0001064 [Ascochyta rabiei]UPX10402.1 hypothetical protein EKO05_0001064 [Ascochyta rabiei]